MKTKRWQIAALTLLMGSVASAQSSYFQGKTITLIVPFSPSGGTDAFARTIAPYLEKHIPGKPRVIVQNKAGGGGLTATNAYVLSTKSDCLNLLVGTSQLNLRALLGMTGTRFSLDQLTPILGTPSGLVAYTSPAVAKSTEHFAKLKVTKPLFLGYHDPLSYAEAMLSLELLGTPYRAVRGYGGKGEVQTAFLRGEVNIDMQNAQAYIPEVLPLVKEGKAVPLFTVGRMDNGKIVRDTAVPDLPTIFEVVKTKTGKEATGPAADALKAVIATTRAAGKILWVQKDAPAECKNVLRDAAKNMAQDKEFLKVLEERAGDSEFMAGADLDASVQQAVSLDPKTRAWLRDFFAKKAGVTFEAK